MKYCFAILGFMASSLFGVEEIVEFQQLPKAELHIHLGGAFPKEFLFSIATTRQKEDLQQSLDLIAQRVDYHAAFHVFRLIAEIVNSEEKVQSGVEHLCAALKRDNVRYTELRTGLKDLGRGSEEYLKSILKGISVHTSEEFKVPLVLSLQRSSSLAAVKQTIDLAIKYRDQGIVGIDISGNSTVGQIEAILPELVRAKDEGLAFIIHMGEAPGETDQMRLLTLLEPKRIGHGVYLEHAAKEWIAERKIPIEVCLTSSVLVKMIEEYRQHPGLDFFRSNHPIVFCTDDPLLFSTTLSHELLYAYQFGGLSKNEIKRVVEDSFQYTLR